MPTELFSSCISGYLERKQFWVFLATITFLPSSLLSYRRPPGLIHLCLLSHLIMLSHSPLSAHPPTQPGSLPHRCQHLFERESPQSRYLKKKKNILHMQVVSLQIYLFFFRHKNDYQVIIQLIITCPLLLYYKQHATIDTCLLLYLQVLEQYLTDSRYSENISCKDNC